MKWGDPVPGVKRYSRPPNAMWTLTEWQTNGRADRPECVFTPDDFDLVGIGFAFGFAISWTLVLGLLLWLIKTWLVR